MHACIVCYLNLVYQIPVIDIGIVQWLSLFWSFQLHAYPFYQPFYMIKRGHMQYHV